MIIRQEEKTPIGDFFHDSGVETIFRSISETVDDFEVDSEQMFVRCDRIVSSIKGLQSLLKKCEKEHMKKKHEQDIDDMIHRSAE